jgi:hypothetical protein
MGRNKVLLFSPRKGELESLCKAKADWLCYYFKEFRPWLPSLYVDRREMWVRVLGIPLHAWGENLFKEIGRKYGEFLDFDESTASRAKLDVARIKLATSLRGFIDDAVKIKVLGVYYTIWVVEEKVSQPVFVQGSGMEDQDCSWVESLKFPAEARVVCGGDSGVPSVEEVEEDMVDFPASPSGKHGEVGIGESDSSLVEVSSEEQVIGVLENIMVTNGMLVQNEAFLLPFVGTKENISGSPAKKMGKGVCVSATVKGSEEVIETCQTRERADTTGGPEVDKSHLNLIAEVGRVSPVVNRFRSESVPPTRFSTHNSNLGLEEQFGPILEDSISLIETRGEGRRNFEQQDEVSSKNSSSNSECQQQQQPQRGRPRKRVPRPKKSKLSTPKCVQLVEAVRGGGSKLGRRRKGVSQKSMSANSNNSGSSAQVQHQHDEELSVVPNSPEGLVLEVVLPGLQQTPRSGINLLSNEGEGDSVLPAPEQDLDAPKLLLIQKQIGFCYKEQDEEIVQVLSNDETRDRLKKQEWEQRRGNQ